MAAAVAQEVQRAILEVNKRDDVYCDFPATIEVDGEVFQFCELVVDLRPLGAMRHQVFGD